MAKKTVPAVTAAPAAPEPGGPWVVGTQYFVRTVTYHLVGRLTHVFDRELVFEDASWVADSGRWHHALGTGRLSEVEPFLGPVILGRGAVVDAAEWRHELPSEPK